MKNGLWARALVASWIGIAAVAAASPATEEQKIRDLDKAWSQAAASKDAARTASFYAEHGAALPFNGPIVSGRAKVQEMWASLMAKPGFAIHFEPTRIVVARSGDVAWDLGTFELTTNDASGKPATVVGKFLVGWRKQKDGQWQVEADAFNTDH